jgi:hypothetical protein
MTVKQLLLVGLGIVPYQPLMLRRGKKFRGQLGLEEKTLETG